MWEREATVPMPILDRQTDRQANRKKKKKSSQTDRQANKESNAQTKKHADKLRGTLVDRPGRQTQIY